MTIDTPQFGTISVKDDEIIHFPNGLIGFEDLKRYTLVSGSSLEPFVWMVAVDEPDVMFALAEPALFDGTPLVPSASDAETLDLADGDEVSVHVIVTFPADAGPILGNVKGPIVFNRSNRLGCQTVLSDESLPYDQPMRERVGHRSSNRR